MATDEPVLCPDCGWTGPATALERVDGESTCPVCGVTIVGVG